MTSSFFSKFDQKLVFYLEDAKVPYYLVRNKIDIDIKDNEEDYGIGEEDTLNLMKEELKTKVGEFLGKSVGKMVYCISSKFARSEEYDAKILLNDIVTEALGNRGVKTSTF